MLGIGKRIEKLGAALAAEFNERARYYFTKAGTVEGQARVNMNLIAAVLSEVATAIDKVTKQDAGDPY